MKAGEQLAAMEMMAVDPRSRVLAPRFVAGIVSLPLLAAIFFLRSAVGGAYLIAVKLIGIDSAAFWSQMQDGVDVFKDVGKRHVQDDRVRRRIDLHRSVHGLRIGGHPGGVAKANHAHRRFFIRYGCWSWIFC